MAFLSGSHSSLTVTTINHVETRKALTGKAMLEFNKQVERAVQVGVAVVHAAGHTAGGAGGGV